MAAEQPPAKAPNQIETAMANWRSGLQTELPQPTLGEGEPPKGSDETAKGGDAKPGDAAPPVQPKAQDQPVQPATSPDPEEKWPRNKQDWDTFKAKRKEREDALTKEIDAHRTRLKELETKAATGLTPEQQAEIERMKKENEEFSQRLQVLDVTQHPRFQTYFQNKIEAQMALAKRIVGEEKGDKVSKLLQLPDSEFKTEQIEALLVDMTPLQQSRFGSVLNALAEIDEERQREVGKAKEHHDKLVADRSAAQSAHKQAVEKQFNDAVNAAQDPQKGLPTYQKRDGDTAWNKTVDERVDLARSLVFGKLELPQVMQHALNAAGYHQLVQSHVALQAEYDKLKAQVAELAKAQPSLESKKNATEEPQQLTIKHGTRPMEATQAWVKGLNERMNQE